jgi:large subunit ribosomal protein L15
MNLKDVHAPGVRLRRKKRVGRGTGSGHGKTSGRGHKGLKSRQGSSVRIAGEGGQMPFVRRIPKRGFNNANFRIEYATVNVSDLETYAEGEKIDLDRLRHDGRIPKSSKRLKILGDGDLNRKLSVSAHRFSQSAKEKIEKAGGSAQVVE